MQSESIPFQDGSISFRRVKTGDRKILFFHGFPGSSSQIHLFKSSSEKMGLDIVCYDRPGYHFSKLPSLNLKKTPSEILQLNVEITQALISHLGWTEFEIVTVSGGTPYGAFITSYFQDHFKTNTQNISISCLRIICGLGDLQNSAVKNLFGLKTKMSLKMIPFIPGSFLKAVIKPEAKSRSARRNKLFEIFYPTSAADRTVIAERHLPQYLSTNLTEALQQDALGPKLDAKVFTSAWSKSLQNLPPTHLWHGDDDKVIPFKVSEAMAVEVYKSKLTLMPSEGHLSLPISRMPEILTQRF